VLVAAAGLLLGLVVLWLRVAWLQVVQHSYYVGRAELNQEQRVLIRPVRGELLDRRGRPLARDLLTWSVSAAPREMADPVVVARGLAALLHLDARRLTGEFRAHPRFVWVARHQPPEVGEAVADRKWRGVHLLVETRRDYTLGAAASEILGRTDLDDSGVDGLELQLDGDLRGRPGWSTLFRVGRNRTVGLPRGLRRAATDGHSAVLTLDFDLQGIVEHHLARAVDTLRAVRGFALFLDPRTGEILASVCVPHLPPGKARNWPFTDQYEPGSTFKVVAAGIALEENLARPDKYFEAGFGRVLVAPGCRFEDSHEARGFTFRGAVQYSSNIVMSKLGILAGPERLYRYATSLGFGSLTGLDFPGEAAGRLHSPAHWSARSCPTIAIGHEVSVTPLQLALAYAAIANGGVLMEPMLVREVRDAEGRVLHRYGPRASHRAFSEATTATLREMLAAVVDSGTARSARIPGFPLAGKTGTAQKYDPAIKTYAHGKYLSSFVGFAPSGGPTLVGVVVIDEPRTGHYYGGEIAAPVFREVMLDLRRLPDGPFGTGSTQVAAKPPAPAAVVVPDLRLLPPTAAERRLAEQGLRARFEGRGPRALAQAPAAGQAAERGASVTVWLAAPAGPEGLLLPDLVGLPLREALRRLTPRQVQTRVTGSGIVVRQIPPAGTPLLPGSECRLWCEPGTAPAASPSPGPLSVCPAGAERVGAVRSGP
jgi:stage V sporulation protein D (sporulation-specific penicillin-binding protein)